MLSGKSFHGLDAAAEKALCLVAVYHISDNSGMRSNAWRLIQMPKQVYMGEGVF